MHSKITEKVNPDVIITDIGSTAGMNGIELIKEMINNSLRGEYIILSGYDDYVYVREAFQMWYSGLLIPKKPASTEDIKEKNYILLLNELIRRPKDNSKSIWVAYASGI